MHPSSPSSFSSPSGGGEEKDFLPAGVYLQQDQTQQYLVQGRLMDDTIAPRPQRSLFSRVANAAAGAVIPASSSSPSSSSTSLPSQPMGSSAPSYHVHQLPSRDLSSSSEDPHSPFSSSSLCQKARIPPTHSSASLSHSSSHLGERGSYLSSSGHMPVGSSTSSSERLSPSSGFSGVHTPNHPPPSLGSGGGGGARVLPRSVEKVIESGEVKIEDINPEQAADISKALLLHQHQNHLLLHEKQQQIQKACQLQRKPLRYHPLSSPSSSSSFTQEEERRSRRGKDGIGGGSSPISAKKESSIKDLREDEERREEGEQEERRRYLGDKNDARTTSLGVDHRRLQMPQPPAFTLSPEELEKSEEKGTRTLNIIREVFYEGIHSHHPSRFPSSCASSLRSSSSSSTTRGRGAGGGEEEQYKKPPGSSSSVRGRRRDISAKGDFSSSEEESISRRENDAARYLEGVRQREEEERERKMRDEEEEEEERKKKMTPQLLSSQRPSTQEARKLRVPSNSSSSSSPPPPCRIILEGGQEGYQQRGEGIDRKENEDEEGETSSSPLEEEESQILEEIEARLKEDAEDFLHEAKIALEESRLTAEREVLALQYIPFKPDRLLHLSNSARESLLGVFVCLCLQHIEGLSSDIQSLVAEWSLIFLHTLASPQVLNVDASVEKSLVRPIVLRDQLLKDGLKTSDILSPAPLVRAVFQACDQMQPEINSIFNALHSQMSCYAATNTHDTPHNPLYNNINHSSSSPSSPPPPSSSSSLLFSSKQGEGRGEKRGSDGGGGGEEKAKSVDRHIESRHEASYEDSSCLRVSEKKEGKGGGDKRGEDEKRTIARQSSSSSFSTARRREGEEGERSENKEEDANRSHRAKTPDEEEVRRHCYEGDLPKNRMIEEKENTKTTDTVTPSLHLHSSSSSFPMQEECLRDCESHPSSSLLFEGGPHALYACERQGISLSSSSFTRDSSTRCSGEMVARGGNRPKSEEEGHQGRAIGAYFYKDEKKKKTDEDQEEEEEKISDRIRRRLEEERKKEIQKQMDSQQETKRKEIEKERKKEEENLMKKDKTEMSDDLDTSTFQDVYSTEEELHRASRLKREPLRQSQKEEEEGDQQLLSHSRGDHGKEEASLRGKDDGDRDGESRQMSSAVEEKKKERSEQDTDGEKKLSSVCSVEDLSSSSSSSPAVSFKAVDAHPLSSSSPPVDTPPRSFASSSSPSRLSHVVHPRDQEGGKGRSEDYRPEAICAVGSIEEHHEEEEELDSLLPSSQSPSRYHLSPSSPAQALLEDRQEDRRRPRRGPSSPSSPNAIKRRSEEERRGRRPSSQDLSSSIIMPVAPPSARTVLLRELTTALVTSGSFDARVQLLLSQFASDMLALNPLILVRLEHHLAADLLDLLKANTKEGARQKTWRRLKIAGAAIGGGFLVALTAGLAAPGIAAGIASLGLGGAGLSAFLASAGGMAVIVSLFGAGGAGLTGWKYSRRIANIKVFEFDMLNGKAPSSLCVTICVSGYLRTFDDISLPWIQALPHACSDLFSLKWEPNILKALGSMVIQMLSQDFAVAAGKYYLQHTALGGLTFALFWPMALIQYASNLDNTWVLCRERAQQAGRLLADAISDTQAVGQRPVTLVGYSMGARVIFYCLQTLWKRRKLHVVCDCVLIGLPASLNTKQWTAARDVVSRRLVNVYSRSDWLLAFLYRWMEWGVQVAGLSPVRSVGGVENYDVTGLVKSHAQYPEKMNDILAFIGFDA